MSLEIAGLMAETRKRDLPDMKHEGNNPTKKKTFD